jgi:hypothetical protein
VLFVGDFSEGFDFTLCDERLLYKFKSYIYAGTGNDKIAAPIVVAVAAQL